MLSKINNVDFKKLNLFKDDRGQLTELFNINSDSFSLAQLNYVNSLENTFRGMHCHSTHSDYLFVLSGKMILALKDCRKSSKTFGQSEFHTLTMENPHIAIIPPGVVHGFYFPENTIYCYGISHPWDANEQLGFRWNAPDSDINWPMSNPIVSERDAQSGTVAELLLDIERLGLTYE